MKEHDTTIKTNIASQSFASSAGPQPARSRRGVPAIAYAAWVSVFIAAIVVLLASLGGYAVWLRGETTVTPGPDPFSPFYILGGLTSLATALMCLGLALALFVRKRNDPMSLFVSFYLIAYGILFAGPLEFLNDLLPGIEHLAVSVIQPLFLTVPTVALLVLFPDGRAVPRWSRWLIPLAGASIVFLPFIDARSASTLNDLPAQLMMVFVVSVLVLAVAAQIYRYRRVSTSSERQQTRLVVFGLMVWLVLGAVQAAPYIYLQQLPPGAERPAWASATSMIWWLSLAAVPLSLAVAILRYRLYEIDIILNHALVYGALTAILAGLYSASITLSQKTFIALTGQKSDAAVVLTTLILASAFTPIRTRLQAAVDRRLRDAHNPLRLADFSKRIDSGVWVVDARLALRKLLDEAVPAFDALSGAACMQTDAAETTVSTHGDWHGDARLTASLDVRGKHIGGISLGPRRNNAVYTEKDRKILLGATDALARALS